MREIQNHDQLHEGGWLEGRRGEVEREWYERSERHFLTFRSHLSKGGLQLFSSHLTSRQTQDRKRRARDYRYLSVMRALIWRYVCSLQRRNEERPVNEDDISEVKGDISSLRFELIDLFGQNGMDVSMCAKKSRGEWGTILDLIVLIPVLIIFLCLHLSLSPHS